MRNMVKIFKALSDANRIRILKMLEVRSLCVCEITEVLNLAASTVSKHLSILREAEFITDEKDGKWVNYRLNTMEYERYINQLLPLINEWLNDDSLIQGDREKARNSNREKCTA